MSLFKYLSSLLDNIKPIITYCPADQDVVTNKRMAVVRWTKPTFMEIPGLEIVISCDKAPGPLELRWGSHQIVCYAEERDSGLRSECRMNFAVTRELIFIILLSNFMNENRGKVADRPFICVLFLHHLSWC